MLERRALGMKRRAGRKSGRKNRKKYERGRLWIGQPAEGKSQRKEYRRYINLKRQRESVFISQEAVSAHDSTPDRRYLWILFAGVNRVRARRRKPHSAIEENAIV